MAIFNSYVSLPEGTPIHGNPHLDDSKRYRRPAITSKAASITAAPFNMVAMRISWAKWINQLEIRILSGKKTHTNMNFIVFCPHTCTVHIYIYIYVCVHMSVCILYASQSVFIFIPLHTLNVRSKISHIHHLLRLRVLRVACPGQSTKDTWRTKLRPDMWRIQWPDMWDIVNTSNQ